MKRLLALVLLTINGGLFGMRELRHQRILLHDVVRSGTWDLVNAMLVQGFYDIDIQDCFTGKTALIEAAVAGKDDVVALLLSYGADRSLTDDYGRTALAYAQEKNKDGSHDAIIEQLQRRYCSPGDDSDMSACTPSLDPD